MEKIKEIFMKIEIGESLMMSYLKHIKKCTFYQLNWKVSSNWDIAKENIEKYQFVYERIINHQEFAGIFKKSDLNQLIKQSEIDVIGMDSNNTIYTVDIAFHESGLSYGDKNETKDRVCKKLLRSYLTLLAYFPNKKYELLFCSPKVNPTPEKIISDYFKILDEIFSTENVAFKYISNEKFYDEILEPTISKSINDSDTNELFIRSMILNNLFEKKINPLENNSSRALTKPILEFIPNEVEFKKRLLEKHYAKRIIYYEDGRQKEEEWDGSNLSETSNLRSNIFSGPLRYWKKEGIIKAKLIIK
jgi:hypothetical protein